MTSRTCPLPAQHAHSTELPTEKGGCAAGALPCYHRRVNYPVLELRDESANFLVVIVQVDSKTLEKVQ